MHLVLISDLHGHLPDIPECDLLLIGGDICPTSNHSTPFQCWWADSVFRPWLDSIPAEHVAGVLGNHDFLDSAEEGREVLGSLRWTWLDNEVKEVAGLSIFGSPYSNRFGNWSHMASEDELAAMWRTIPSDIDILITHGPPYGVGDLVPPKYSMPDRDSRVGSSSLTHQLCYSEWPNLKLHMFGHIHDGYGEYELNSIPLFNCSQMNEEYRPVNSPHEVELP